MIKNDNKRYSIDGQRLCLKSLYEAAPRVEGKNRNMLRFIRTELAPGIPMSVVFVRHRSKKKGWLAPHTVDGSDLIRFGHHPDLQNALGDRGFL